VSTSPVHFCTLLVVLAEWVVHVLGGVHGVTKRVQSEVGRTHELPTRVFAAVRSPAVAVKHQLSNVWLVTEAILACGAIHLCGFCIELGCVDRWLRRDLALAGWGAIENAHYVVGGLPVEACVGLCRLHFLPALVAGLLGTAQALHLGISSRSYSLVVSLLGSCVRALGLCESSLGLLLNIHGLLVVSMVEECATLPWL